MRRRIGVASVLAMVLSCGAFPASAATWFVVTNGSDAAAGTNWVTAKQTIQAAIDVAAASDTVLVSNGIYETGGRAAPGGSLLTNRVTIEKALRLESVNGPSFTTIRGAWDPLTTNGDAAVRCVWLTNGATLIGFTLTSGATRGGFPPPTPSVDTFGGGLCAPTSSPPVIEDCVIIGNSAGIGGGAAGGILNRCSILGNSATSGGGVWGGVLDSCLVRDNAALVRGGGAYECTIHNSTVVGNAGGFGGGARNCTLLNSIVYFNTAGTSNNEHSCSISFTCSTPLPAGPGNITNDPLFVSLATTNLQLAANSPCINLGHNAFAPGTTDLAGNPRIVNTVVDMGAYEFQGAANPDYDNDGWSNEDEYIAATDPTNAASFFPELLLTNAPPDRMSLVIASASTGRVYGVFVNTNLMQTPQAWTLIPPEQTGTAASLTLTITNSLPGANYRTGVRLP